MPLGIHPRAAPFTDIPNRTRAYGDTVAPRRAVSTGLYPTLRVRARVRRAVHVRESAGIVIYTRITKPPRII